LHGALLHELLLRLHERLLTVNKKGSPRIALGGVFSALCLVFMSLTGVIPLSSFAMPAVAGAMLMAVVVEAGHKTALLIYIAVSALCLFILPDRQAAIAFALFLGYYPIVKEKIERIPRRATEWAVKLALFNAAAIGGFAAFIFIAGVPMPGFDAGIPVPGIIIAANAAFLLYDIALTKYITAYIKWLKPKLLRRQ